MRSVVNYGRKLFSCGQRRLRSDLADAEADLSLLKSQSDIISSIEVLMSSCKFGATCVLGSDLYDHISMMAYNRTFCFLLRR